MAFFIISIILLILLLVLFMPLKIFVSYEEKKAILNIKLAGITIFKFSPKNNKKPKKNTEDIVEDIKNDSQSLCDKIKFYSELSKLAVKLMRKYILIESVYVKIDVGTSDAPSTAICTGALWGIIYQVLGVIGSIMYIKSNTVEVNPCFNDTKFSANAKCIIKSRPAYIIFIAIIIFIKIKSLKGKED